MTLLVNEIYIQYQFLDCSRFVFCAYMFIHLKKMFNGRLPENMCLCRKRGASDYQNS